MKNTQKGFICPAIFRTKTLRDDKRGRVGVTERAAKGFTLIELLVVVLIIGVLAAVAVPQYQKAVLKSRYTQLQIWGRTLFNAQQVFFMANGKYATTFDELDIDLQGTLSEGKKKVSTGKAYCEFNGDYPEFFCNIVPSQSLTLLVAYQAKTILCRAYSETAKNICLSMGGIYRGVGSTGYTDYYLYRES